MPVTIKINNFNILFILLFKNIKRFLSRVANCMKEDIFFIVNPIAGAKNKAPIPYNINKHINRSVFNPEIIFTDFSGHATQLTKELLARSAKYVVAVGGDGTINEIATAMMNTEATLGIIPAGSGNGLARHLNIPMDIVKAIEVINSRKEITIDCGNVNGRYFFCTAGVGFDAHIGKLFAESERRGFGSYIYTTIKEFSGYQPLKYTITTNGYSEEIEAFSITFANAAQYGNNAYISPEADISDGLLDICILKPFPRHRAIEIGYRLFTKSLHKSRYLKIIRAKKFTISREEEGALHVDGEPILMGAEINVNAIPKSLRVLRG